MNNAPLESLILIIRGQKVLLDADLAVIYGVPTKALNQAVKRNAERFPEDFLFQISPDEKSEVVTICDHLARLKFSRQLPFAFTEHGALMVANVLNSPEAVRMSVHVIRAFIKQRELLTGQTEILKKTRPDGCQTPPARRCPPRHLAGTPTPARSAPRSAQERNRLPRPRGGVEGSDQAKEKSGIYLNGMATSFFHYQ